MRGIGKQIRLDAESDIVSNVDIASEKQKQDDYEAEVVVYRALENLNEPITGFHGLKYSHLQFRIWEKSHEVRTCRMCRDHPNVDECEHDFIVFGPDYIVLIEVKNPSIPQFSTLTSKNPITSAIEKAHLQFEKGLTLLQRILNSSEFENGDIYDIRVFRFVALPNISPEQSKYVINTDVINGDDFNDFNSFWRLNVKSKESFMSEAPVLCQKNLVQTRVMSETVLLGDIKTLQNVVLRLFASGGNIGKKKKSHEIDEAKLSLKECVIEIDKQLRNSEITFRGKNTPSNPSVIKTSDLKEPPFVVNGVNIFKTCLEVNYITVEQKNAFEDDNYPILITGAAGSGKTMVLLAKAISLILTKRHTKTELTQQHTKVFIMFSNELTSYSEIFKKAGLKLIEGSNWFDESLYTQDDIIIRHMPGTRGVNYKYRDPQDTELHLFVDDCQDQVHYWECNYGLGDKWSCLAVDCTQANEDNRRFYRNWLNGERQTDRNLKFHWLGKSYRSTHNIVSQLIELGKQYELKKQQTEIVDKGEQQFTHIPEHGHFIHGPQLRVKISRNEQMALKNLPCFLDKLITRELNQDSEIYEDPKISCAFILAGPSFGVKMLEKSLQISINSKLINKYQI